MAKKLLAVLVVVLLMLAPMSAMAQEETGYASLKIIDPVLSFSGASIDFTGLELDLASAVDLKNPAAPAVTYAIAALVNGEEVLSAAAVTDFAQIAFALTGLQNAYKVDLAALLEDQEVSLSALTEAFAAASVVPDEAALEGIEEELQEELLALVQMEELGEQEIEYGGKTVTAQVVKATFDKKVVIAVYEKLFDLAKLPAEETQPLLDAMDEAIEELAVTETIYVIDEQNTVVDLDIRVTAEGDTILGTGRATVVLPETGEGLDLTVTFSMAQEGVPEETVELKGDFTFGESTEFEGAWKANGSLTVYIPTDPANPALTVKGDVTPKAAADGWHYDFSFDADLPGEGGLAASGSLEQTADRRADAYELVIKDSSNETQKLAFSLDGALLDANGDKSFDGTVHFGGVFGGQEAGIDVKVQALLSESIEGRSIDIASLNAIDFLSLSATDMEALQAEAMGVIGGASAKLMTIPGVQLILGGLTGGDTGYSEEIVE
jgi:hypothetical protein